jgi:hypothetical protein
MYPFCRERFAHACAYIFTYFVLEWIDIPHISGNTGIRVVFGIGDIDNSNYIII